MWSDADIADEQGSSILIDPLSEESVTPVGYDIRIGFAYRLGADNDERPSRRAVVAQGQSLVLGPGELLYIQTLEFLWLSAAVGAVCHVKGSLGTKGLLLLNPSTVDPNWSGDLVFVLKNVGDHRLTIEHGMKIITIVFHTFRTPTDTVSDTRVKQVTTFYGDLGEERFAAEVQRYDEARSGFSREFARKVAHADRRGLLGRIRHGSRRWARRHATLAHVAHTVFGTTRGRLAGLISLVAIAIISGVVSGLAQGWYQQLFSGAR